MEPQSDVIRIADVIEDLLRTISRQACCWRVPEDAVDKTYDRLVDRIIDGSPPEDFQSWANLVLLNQFKSGPERTEMRSARMVELPRDISAGDSLDRRTSLAVLRQRLEQLGSEARGSLTKLEQSALHAMLTQPTMAAAANASGMTERDLRARRGRIVKKIRALLGAE
jgi:hypothetical protein